MSNLRSGGGGSTTNINHTITPACCRYVFVLIPRVLEEPPTGYPNSDRILSIQSHVAFGYVGGKAAVFPLQCMGYDVDVVNTVNFSNHTALDAVHHLARRLKAGNPELIYLLDPVLGDAGKLYVAEDVIPVYRQILPLATAITPNWFEVETLTEIKLTDLNSLRRALSKLHVEYQVPNVVISSIPLSQIATSVPNYLLPSEDPPEIIDDTCKDSTRPPTTLPDNQQYLLCVASSVNSSSLEMDSPLSIVHARCVPFIPGYFSGVGDLFSALLLGHFHARTGATVVSSGGSYKHTTSLAVATAHALSKTHAILSLTNAAASQDSLPPTDDELDAREPQRQSKRMKGRELRLVQGQDIFRSKDPVEAMIMWEGFWEE
ncbi:hypothetical protein ID866_3093 [Astraeus odoratus]|nr:hypothetical protein ID866_3093 [Astraeus odoratus]